MIHVLMESKRGAFYMIFLIISFPLHLWKPIEANVFLTQPHILISFTDISITTCK